MNTNKPQHKDAPKPKPKKDYVVVIEATEVGDPTGGIQFKIINDVVENLSVELVLDNPHDAHAPGKQLFSFSSIAQNELVTICIAFTDPDLQLLTPKELKAIIVFSTDNEDNFSLAPDQGINNNFESSSPNTFVDHAVPVVTPAYHTLASTALVFVQCLEESSGNQAFLYGDAQTGAISMRNNYTNQSPGMTWILTRGTDGYFKLALNDANNDAMFGDTDTGTLSLQKENTSGDASSNSWKFLPGNVSEDNNNFYQLESLGSGMKKYLLGNTNTGGIHLVEALDENSRAMKWYIHVING